MNIFKRLFRIGQAEIHAAVDKMEDPIKMTEQGLRELREDLTEATEAYAKVKAPGDPHGKQPRFNASRSPEVMGKKLY